MISESCFVVINNGKISACEGFVHNRAVMYFASSTISLRFLWDSAIVHFNRLRKQLSIAIKMFRFISTDVWKLELCMFSGTVKSRRGWIPLIGFTVESFRHPHSVSLCILVVKPFGAACNPEFNMLFVFLRFHVDSRYSGKLLNARCRRYSLERMENSHPS